MPLPLLTQCPTWHCVNSHPTGPRIPRWALVKARDHGVHGKGRTKKKPKSTSPTLLLDCFCRKLMVDFLDHHAGESVKPTQKTRHDG
ncbi:hypothetical protein GUJ93_ZPchr0011g27726 [Zizania palustris]|uniref:Uncharacterized protein n=1 Tax=Zizania palustris TaxID=103762 RepID=A0A8J5WIK2_ZIZPA|nr:hypothetical protein GUJ93_ZPchr0011g27726 [Zizania palustris]